MFPTPDRALENYFHICTVQQRLLPTRVLFQTWLVGHTSAQKIKSPPSPPKMKSIPPRYTDLSSHTFLPFLFAHLPIVLLTSNFPLPFLFIPVSFTFVPFLYPLPKWHGRTSRGDLAKYQHTPVNLPEVVNVYLLAAPHLIVQGDDLKLEAVLLLPATLHPAGLHPPAGQRGAPSRQGSFRSCEDDQ